MKNVLLPWGLPAHPHSLIRIFAGRMEMLWSLTLSIKRTALFRLRGNAGRSETSLVYLHICGTCCALTQLPIEYYPRKLAHTSSDTGTVCEICTISSDALNPKMSKVHILVSTFTPYRTHMNRPVPRDKTGADRYQYQKKKKKKKKLIALEQTYYI